MHGPDGLHHVIRIGRLQDITSSARADRIEDLVLVLEDRLHQEMRLRVARLDGFHAVDAVHSGHPDVHHDHVRMRRVEVTQAL